MQELKYTKLHLIDNIGVSSTCFLFSPLNNTFIYTFGSTIIYYDLLKNKKTFLQCSNNELISLKFLDHTENTILSIDASYFPNMNVWDLTDFKILYSKEIPIREQFETSEIFIETIRTNFNLILLSSNKCKYKLLYIFCNEGNKYEIELFCKIPNFFFLTP